MQFSTGMRTDKLRSSWLFQSMQARRASLKSSQGSRTTCEQLLSSSQPFCKTYKQCGLWCRQASLGHASSVHIFITHSHSQVLSNLHHAGDYTKNTCSEWMSEVTDHLDKSSFSGLKSSGDTFSDSFAPVLLPVIAQFLQRWESMPGNHPDYLNSPGILQYVAKFSYFNLQSCNGHLHLLCHMPLLIGQKEWTSLSVQDKYITITALHFDITSKRLPRKSLSWLSIAASYTYTFGMLFMSAVSKGAWRDAWWSPVCKQCTFVSEEYHPRFIQNNISVIYNKR